MILQRLPNTLVLMLSGLLLASILAIPIGILAAFHRGKPLDYLPMSLVLVGIGVPRFWLGLLLISSMAYVARAMRSSMLEVLRKDYITTAQAKGLLEKAVIYKHALKNAINPIIALFGLDFGWMIGGAVMVEFVFSRPGLGKLIVDSIYMRDYLVFQVLILFLTSSVILGNITGDILLAVTDPRIRYK